ncbi:hypothetical protein EJ02DRAFT_372769, partial [Clathrospora elynae]
MTECGWITRVTRGVNPDTADQGWFCTVEVPHHNHKKATLGRLAFTQNRKHSGYVRDRIEQGWKQHDTAAKILDDLIASNHFNILRSDIKNEIQKLRMAELAGRSPVEALLDFLEKF